MSTPISEPLRACVLGLAALALAACAGGIAGNPTRASVRAGGVPVVIAGPPGFCIDGQSTSVTSAGAFVLLGDCLLLGGTRPDPAAPAGAALTASVSTVGLGTPGTATRSLADIERFAATPAGRAALGRSGRSDRIRIVTSQTRGEVLYVLVEDRGPQPIAGVEREFWRAFLEVNGRLTALAVLRFQGGGVSPQQGLDYLVAFASAIRQANGAQPLQPQSAAPGEVQPR